MGLLNLRLKDPLSLNTLRHLDPVGALMLFIFRFGRAKYTSA